MNLDPAQALAAQVPFRHQLSTETATPVLEGALPAWLEGRLVRTAPAVFTQPGWSASHWFDGLGMLYAFELGGGKVAFRQRQLQSAMAQRAAQGRHDITGFGSKNQRGFWKRLVQPVPEAGDNTNVNVLQLGDELVALTETAVQWVIDPATLASVRHVQWTDSLGAINLLAHPQLDVEKNEVVNVSPTFGAKPGLSVIAHAPGGRERRVVGLWQTKRIPYAHSFGLTPSSVVLIGHPFDVNPLSLLWSNDGFIEHFKWRPEAGTTLAVMDRATGATRTFQAPACFVFHVINAFDRGDDVVLDALAYDDVGIIERLRPGALSEGLPDLRPKPVRWVLSKGATTAKVEPLGDQGFEFPQIAYRQVNGRPYTNAWGTEVSAQGSTVLRVEVGSKVAARFSRPGVVFGEPIFVAAPGATDETDGVLLVVGTHQSGASQLAVLDAKSLEPRATATVDLPIPLGFHGSFVRGKRQAS